jgi:energy-coupling factor transport system permease protein
MLVSWRYRRRRSLIQSFDPRAWIIFYLCFMGVTISFWDVRVLAVTFVVSLSIVLTSGISWREMRRAWLFIGGFILYFSLFTFLTGRGGIEFYAEEHVIRNLQAPFILFGWRPVIHVTAERAFYALSMLVRVFSLASMTILIPYSFNPAQYGVTFRGLGLPDKIAYAMDLTMRFVPTYARDFQLTMDAQRARGYEIEKLRGGLVSQVRRLAPLIVPVTIQAIAGSEDIIDAMDLRAFGVRQRTWLEQLHYRPRDKALMILGVSLLILSLALAFLGLGQFWIPESLRHLPLL